MTNRSTDMRNLLDTIKLTESKVKEAEEFAGRGTAAQEFARWSKGEPSALNKPVPRSDQITVSITAGAMLRRTIRRVLDQYAPEYHYTYKEDKGLLDSQFAITGPRDAVTRLVQGIEHAYHSTVSESVDDDSDADADQGEDLEERAPHNPKAERFIKGHKHEFNKRYGKDHGENVLYATAWKKFGESVDECEESEDEEDKKLAEGLGRKIGKAVKNTVLGAMAAAPFVAGAAAGAYAGSSDYNSTHHKPAAVSSKLGEEIAEIEHGYMRDTNDIEGLESYLKELGVIPRVAMLLTASEFEQELEDRTVTAPIYGYFINLDERGEFYADVRDTSGKTVYEIKNETGDDEFSDEEEGEIDEAEGDVLDQDIARPETFTGPSAWASYLVNGDASSLNDEEKVAADKWLEGIQPYHVVSVEGEPRFTWSYDLYGGLAKGGEVVDYECLKSGPHPSDEPLD